MTSIPYLISDGNTGVLVSETGKCIQSEKALEELTPSLDSLVLIWVSSTPSALKSFPSIKRWKIRKCLEEFSGSGFFVVSKEIYTANDVCVYMHCKTPKSDLDRCLFFLRTCHVIKIIPLEMFLWECCLEGSITSFSWKKRTYAIYKSNQEPQLIQVNLLGENPTLVLEHFSLTNGKVTYHHLLDVMSSCSRNISCYSVSKSSARGSKSEFNSSLVVASLVFLFGAFFLHLKREEMILEAGMLDKEYNMQSQLHQVYQQDLAKYDSLSESLGLWETIAWCNLRSDQINLLVAKFGEFRADSIQLDSEIGEITAKWSLKNTNQEDKKRFIQEASNFADSLGKSCHMSFREDILHLTITPRRLNCKG